MQHVEQSINACNPLVGLQIEVVEHLIEVAAERGRTARGDLKFGICGKHSGDHMRIAFCEKVGVDYVSASPYRVHLARPAAAHASTQLPAESTREE